MTEIIRSASRRAEEGPDSVRMPNDLYKLADSSPRHSLCALVSLVKQNHRAQVYRRLRRLGFGTLISPASCDVGRTYAVGFADLIAII